GSRAVPAGGLPRGRAAHNRDLRPCGGEELMADMVSWSRLEPGSRDRELAPGLEARLYDPLWLLGRQWQFGEFAAGRSGSAIAANVSATVAPLNAVRQGRTGAPAPYAVGGPPLEAVVEADDVHAAPTLGRRGRPGPP